MSVSETFDRKFNKSMRGYNTEEVDAALDALLRYFPRRYEDWSAITPIAQADFSDTVCIKARIISPITEHYKRIEISYE